MKRKELEDFFEKISKLLSDHEVRRLKFDLLVQENKKLKTENEVLKIEKRCLTEYIQKLR